MSDEIHLQRNRKFAELVEGTQCKGVRAEYLTRPHHQHLKNMLPTNYLRRCYSLVGKQPTFPPMDPEVDNSITYAAALRAAGWEEVRPEPGEDIFPILESHDLLTWAYSEDGAGGCNPAPGMNGGNTTTGFLIDAAGEYPTAWVSADSVIPSGVYPLAQCLELEKNRGSGAVARLIYIHRPPSNESQ